LMARQKTRNLLRSVSGGRSKNCLHYCAFQLPLGARTVNWVYLEVSLLDGCWNRSLGADAERCCWPKDYELAIVQSGMGGKKQLA
jgi:hypothetical protein